MATIVAAGDFHVPHRADGIPNGFYKAIERIRPGYLVLTGDYTEKRVYEEVVARVKEIVPNIVIAAVRGNMDTFKDLPTEDFIDLSGGRILGVIHGHQIFPRGDTTKLYKFAEKRGRTILIHGHTHTFSVEVPIIVGSKKHILLVNPGTLTGARGGITLNPQMTFATLYVDPARGYVEVERRESEDGETFDVVATRKSVRLRV